MKMNERYITRTIKVNKVSANCVDFANKAFVDKTFLITGDLSNDELLKVINSKDKNLLANTITENVISEELYKLSESDFITNGFTDSEKKEKNVRYISRTITNNACKVICADFEKQEFSICDYSFTGDMNVYDIIAKATARFYPLIPGKVTDIKTTETMYYLSETDFLRLAEKVNK